MTTSEASEATRRLPAGKGPELLAPAGSLEKLKVAIRYGADAVYLGGKDYSLRSKAENFSDKELRQAISYCRSRGVRSYVTVNIFPRNSDLDGIREFLSRLEELEPDGIIVSDPGVFQMAKRLCPHVPLHVSTQANVTNVEAARFWQGLGAGRINLARELSFREIREFKRALSCQIEVFVHGALCISWSGRCLLSLYMTGRDANKGACAHPCRYSYRLEEEKRPGEFFPVEEDGRGTYIFSSRDLCLVSRLFQLAGAGVDGLKIEGRTKGIFYLAIVVRVYRAALDSALEALRQGADGWRPPEAAFRELSFISSRKYTENFFQGTVGPEDMAWQGTEVDQSRMPAALVLRAGEHPLFRAFHVIRPGDRLEYMDSGLDDRVLTVERLVVPGGQELEKTLGGEELHIEFREPVRGEPYSLLRKAARR